MADEPVSEQVAPKKPRTRKPRPLSEVADRIRTQEARAAGQQQRRAERAQAADTARTERARARTAEAGLGAQQAGPTERRIRTQAPRLLDRPVRSPVGDVPLIPVAFLVVGAYLAWFGVHYWGSDTKWPTDPIKALLTGQPIPTPDTSARQAAIQGIGSAVGSAAATGAAAAAAAAAGGSGSSGGGGTAAPITGPIVPGTRSAIAQYAQRYNGAGYVWGGPADRIGNWDCSSFVSWVLGHDLQMKLPGGGKYGDPGYPPHAHGPTTTEYMFFGQPLTQGQVQPGDLIVSSEHMGIAISATEYMSALNPSAGTHAENFLVGFPGGPPVYRRVI